MNNDKIHYYGWNYIKSELSTLNFNNIFLIDYVDNYFIKLENKITKPWVGIIHHTSSDFSTNNIINLFMNDIFKESLISCQGLITLSEYNKKSIINELNKIQLNIIVYVLKHPMPPIYKYFNINLFEKNLKIINIGGWLRNSYSIYHNEFLYEHNNLEKYKLKGYCMNEYFPIENININKIINNKINYISKNNTLSYSRTTDNISYFYSHMIQYINNVLKYYSYNEINNIINNNNTIKIQEYVSNETYLDLITSSIIYCDYIDCSASNTIVECIATCTPIILNRLPALEEYLGSEYPLYIDNLNKIDLIYKTIYYLDKYEIYNAHMYLVNLKNKHELELDFFLEKLQNILNNN